MLSLARSLIGSFEQKPVLTHEGSSSMTVCPCRQAGLGLEFRACAIERGAWWTVDARRSRRALTSRCWEQVGRAKRTRPTNISGAAQLAVSTWTSHTVRISIWSTASARLSRSKGKQCKFWKCGARRSRRIRTESRADILMLMSAGSGAKLTKREKTRPWGARRILVGLCASAAFSSVVNFRIGDWQHCYR